MSFNMISTSVHFPVDVMILFFMSELNFIVCAGGQADRQTDSQTWGEGGGRHTTDIDSL